MIPEHQGFQVLAPADEPKRSASPRSLPQVFGDQTRDQRRTLTSPGRFETPPKEVRIHEGTGDSENLGANPLRETRGVPSIDSDTLFTHSPYLDNPNPVHRHSARFRVTRTMRLRNPVSGVDWRKWIRVPG